MIKCPLTLVTLAVSVCTGLLLQSSSESPDQLKQRKNTALHSNTVVTPPNVCVMQAWEDIRVYLADWVL